MMKIIYFIFSFYLLVLSVYPCCLEHDYADERVKTEQTVDHRDDYEKSECESCSSFATCGSCPGFTFVNLEELNFKKSSFSPANYQQIYGYKDSLFLWRPPKTG